MWDDFVTKVNEVTNNPVVIAIVVALLLLLIVCVVINKTSFGKKTINNVKKDFENLKTDLTKKVDDNTEKVKETTNKVSTLTTNYGDFTSVVDTHLALIYEHDLKVREGFIKIIAKIPNAKVKKELEDFLDNTLLFETDLNKALEESANAFYEHIDFNYKEVANVNVFRLYEENAFLTDKVNRLEELVVSLSNGLNQGDLTPQNECCDEVIEEKVEEVVENGEDKDTD